MIIHVPCPVCNEQLEAKLTIIEDAEGSTDVINGMHYFLSIDDYSINLNGHGEECWSYAEKHEQEIENLIMEEGHRRLETE